MMMMIRPKYGTKFTISVRVPPNPQDIELQTPKWMQCIIQRALKICREGMMCMETIDNGGCNLLKTKAKILCSGIKKPEGERSPRRGEKCDRPSLSLLHLEMHPVSPSEMGPLGTRGIAF